MRQRTLFLFREFKNNAVFRIAYIVYFLLTVAVLAYALLNMLAGLSVDKFLYGVQIILLASLLHFIFYSLISYEFCCSLIVATVLSRSKFPTKNKLILDGW